MADGQVEVSVRAEGVEDAAGEMGGDMATPDIGGPGGDGGGGGGRGKILGKTLSRILGLLAFLGPMLDLLGIVSQILEAFVAPLAVVLLRLLQPTLRGLLRVLPVWFEIADLLVTAADAIARVRTAIWGAIFSAVARIGGWILSLPERIWEFMQRLPTMIGTEIKNAIPKLRNNDNVSGRDIGELLSTGGDLAFGTPAERGRAAGEVIIRGGLGAFIKNITQDSDFDFP